MSSSWVQCFTEKGEYPEGLPYYYNKETGKTQWEEPLEYTYRSYCMPQSNCGSSVKFRIDSRSPPPRYLSDPDVEGVLRYHWSGQYSSFEAKLHSGVMSASQLYLWQESHNIAIGTDEEWKVAFYSKNAYLGYVVTSQFVVTSPLSYV